MVLVTTGVFTLPETSALAIAFGDVVYFHDGSPGVVDKTDAGGLASAWRLPIWLTLRRLSKFALDGVGTIDA